jgi:hypothetical protein
MAEKDDSDTSAADALGKRCADRRQMLQVRDALIGMYTTKMSR